MSWQGLSLSFSGYDQRLPELAELVGDSLRTFAIEPLAFERQRDGLRRRLSGLEQRQPVAWVRGRGRGRGRVGVGVGVRLGLGLGLGLGCIEEPLRPLPKLARARHIWRMRVARVANAKKMVA